MPVGNFTAINLVAGSMRIPFRPYLFGTLLGAMPGIVILTLFADGIVKAVQAPSAVHAAYALVAVVISIGLALLLRRAFKKRLPRP
jgi:uncharacterized membrane protein YdjX (TVP38/TMEM64 family)